MHSALCNRRRFGSSVEGHPEFRVFPTFAVVPTFPAVMKLLMGINADLNKVVHGGQDVRLHRAIPLDVPLTSSGKNRRNPG